MDGCIVKSLIIKLFMLFPLYHPTYSAMSYDPDDLLLKALCRTDSMSDAVFILAFSLQNLLGLQNVSQHFFLQVYDTFRKIPEAR